MTDGEQDLKNDHGMRERVVLFADLVESVRLMQQQENLVIARWRGFCAEVREQIVPGLGGRVVRSAGDALLLTFSDSASAAQAAFTLHERMEVDRFDGTPPLRLRIGLHRTECLEDEHDAYGSGVNLTARLASLAAPGETVVSAELRSSLHDGVQADFEDMGPRYLKHVQAPVRAFRARRVGQMRRVGSASATPVQDLRPLLAIVPFRPTESAAPPDSDLAALGHAASDALSLALSRHPRMRLLSRGSTSALRHERLDALHLGQLHERFDIAYLLTGQLSRKGTLVQLQFELCALPSLQVLWAHTAALPVQELFSGPSTVMAGLGTQVGAAIAAHGQTVLRRLPMDSLPAYSLYLGACSLMNSLMERDFQRAREAFEHLAERHPRQPAPVAMLARWHVTHGVQSWAAGTSPSGYTMASALAMQALDLDAEQTDALCALALTALNVEHDVDKALRLNEAALRIDPGESTALMQISAVQALSGATDLALASASRALHLTPLDPDRYLIECYGAMAALAAGEAQQAAAWAAQSLQRQVLHAPTHRFHIAALWQAGEPQRAREALNLFAQVCPEAHASGIWHMEAGPRWRREYEDALFQAGLHRSSP